MARAGQEVRVRQLDRQKAVILNSVADGIIGVDSTKPDRLRNSRRRA